MPCLIVILGLFVPRVVLFLCWLLTDLVQRAFQTWLWPLLGLIFMPYTTLAYMIAADATNQAISGGWIALIVIGVILDLGGTGGSVRTRRQWRRRA